MSTLQAIGRNHLATETSPYLLQHAGNPVDWWPWCEEALELARRKDKPILLSIGYSACHWCHVMAHESFEDDETAEVMNELFVNIKVDREERPDLDKTYQLAHQVLSRRPGGWPLTVFLDPQTHAPFFAGTYFPKTARYNLPAFVSLLRQAGDWYRRHRATLAQDGHQLQDALKALAHSDYPAEKPSSELLQRCLETLRHDFDHEYGGFGGAPKFPHVGVLGFLLDGDGSAQEMALHSLRKMAEGGIYDHIGGGFCRYSVDAAWVIPHFEKMLYDNGPLIALYAHAWKLTGDPLYQKVATESAVWAIREMRTPEGAFYASLDADSEGEEGRFYVWSREECQAVLSAEEYALIASHYGLGRPPNFENHWHLHVVRPLSEAAQRLGMTLGETESMLASARTKIGSARAERVRPGTDDKVLTAWNALMIKGLACAGRVLHRSDFVEAAQAAFDFLHDALWVDGRLRATWKDGRARFAAYLDDYVFLMDAGLELLQSRWSTKNFKWICQMADALLDHFEDKANGGFFFTAHDHESLIYRPKSLQDESMPAGNAIGARVLLRLGAIVGDSRYSIAGERVLALAAGALSRYPLAHGAMLAAAAEWLYPPRLLVLRGDSEALSEWSRIASSSMSPSDVCLSIPMKEQELPGMLLERKPLGTAVAYVCEGVRCLPPIVSVEEFKALVTSAERSV